MGCCSIRCTTTTTTMPMITRILCPVDFSEASRHGVEQAVVIAGWYRAPLTALHVYSPVLMPVPALPALTDRVPAPELQLEIPLSAEPDFIQGISDLLVTVLPQIAKADAALARLGDLGTLPERLRAEVAASKGVVPWMGLVGVWSRTPANEPSRTLG